MPTPQSIVLSDVSFGFDPLDAPLLQGLSATIPPGRTGVVGRNGTGKTTLLRLISGELPPTSGDLLVPGEVAHVRQDLFQRPEITVAQLLGIDDTLSALRAIEAGSLAQQNFDAVADHWDVESRAVALLAKRLPSLQPDGVLDRPAGSLSGGELMLVAMCGLELSGAPISVLDEPTNNLDARSREALYAAVKDWKGTLLVVSHDVALLNLMDAILEIHDGGLRVFGGNYDDYTQRLDAEQAAAEQAVRAAEQKVRAESRERDHIQTAMARRKQKSKKDFLNKRAPRIVMNAWGQKSEKVRAAEMHKAAAKVAEAQSALGAAEERIRDDSSIRVEIVDPGVAAGRLLAELAGTDRTVHVTGGLRLALIGNNGVGKTALLRTMLHPDAPSQLPARGRLLTTRFGYLDQTLALDGAASALQVVQAAAPRRQPQEIRGGLARFLLRGDIVERPVGSLSGGERFRVAFARLLLADPPPELLILDEPTNNLDLDSVEQLIQGLRSYRGALLVVSHDQHLLDRLELDEVVELGPDGTLTVP
ncbi:ATP-binding cassette domain-containing protein [Tessaracoccus sp. OS52]|uniref:ABC-F family ATP-binding cassette domain-containing protein n=1 Tax=Tessaracoccus sp. OS52 TaxID=2886691 RepID=UPI001D10FB44|nr:ABC-F family ATP-binding cassette domain-containing protein [Tessaracoccus sp. OS52]MCC2592943.1 ATP-binding cassette domain-containing protein [Tessaracoccus sp. OS52]